jgi:F0F1-type ATP synthase assembly protein I
MAEPARPKDAESGSRDDNPWKLAYLGFHLAATYLGFFALGYWLDKTCGTMPWLTVTFTVLGFIGGFYLLVKETDS